MPEPSTETATSNGDLLPRVLLALGVFAALAMVAHRALGWMPPDLSAYLAAVDIWRDGFNPYTDKIFDSPRSEGFPFLYPPASLWIFYPVDLIPTLVVTVVDGIARSIVAALLVVWVHRRFLPEFDVGWVVLGATMCSPLLVDAITGNLAVYMLGAVALTVELADREFTPARFVGIALAGLAIGVKPMWAIPAVYAVVCARNRWAFLALALGGGTVLGVSLLDRHLFSSWLMRVDEVSAFYESVDFLKLSPALAIVAAAAWLVPAAWLAWKRPPNAWLFGLASVCMWPRLAVYTYLVTMPIVAFFVARWGYRRGLALALPVIGPLPWLLRDPAGGIYERWTLLIWAVALAVLTGWELLRAAPARAEVES